mgnify:CR=1 FL=1
MIGRLIASIPAHWIDYIGIAGMAFSIGYGLAAETETAVQIVREVVHVSASAASCRFDDAAAAGLNRLRQP